MELLTKEIPYSNKDKLVNITLPTELNEDLAEFVGIVAGDGHLNCFSKRNWNSFSITITGSISEDIEYFNIAVQPLFTRLFNTRLRVTYQTHKNYFNANNCSKAIVIYLNKNFQIPIGNKCSLIHIPRNIIESENLVLPFVRGLADTDFSLGFKNKGKSHSYPVIKGSFKSRAIVEDLNKVLRNFEFSTNVCFNESNFDKRFGIGYERHSIYISGHKNLERWMAIIGFRNPRLVSKYMTWKKLGFCPPNTKLKERLILLE